MPIRLTRHQPQKPGVIGPWSLPRPLLPTRPSGEQYTGGPAGHLQAPRAGLLPLGFAPSHQPGSRTKGHGAGRAGPAAPGGGHGRCCQARPGGRQRCPPWFCHPPGRTGCGMWARCALPRWCQRASVTGNRWVARRVALRHTGRQRGQSTWGRGGPLCVRWPSTCSLLALLTINGFSTPVNAYNLVTQGYIFCFSG
jgi:hypothetical protein